MKKNNLLLVASLGLLAASCGTGGPRKTPGGIDYTIDKAGKGEKIKEGDTVLMHITNRLNDSLLFSTHQQDGQPIPLVITKSQNKFDLMDGFVELREGDSATFIIPVDSIPNTPPFAKKGDKLRVSFVVDGIYSAAKQTDREEKEIDAYVTKQGLKTTKTANGVRISVMQEGTGETPAKGDIVSVYYTGKLLNGTVFDSNQDTTMRPGPLTPITFPVGQGQVIKGWDEALSQLKKGTKATIIIPSSQAYGFMGQPPMIKGNSILVFTVELVDIKKPEAAPAEAPVK